MVYLLTLRHLRLSFQIVILQSNIKFPEGVQLETCFFFNGRSSGTGSGNVCLRATSQQNALRTECRLGIFLVHLSPECPESSQLSWHVFLLNPSQDCVESIHDVWLQATFQRSNVGCTIHIFFFVGVIKQKLFGWNMDNKLNEKFPDDLGNPHIKKGFSTY